MENGNLSDVDSLGVQSQKDSTEGLRVGKKMMTRMEMAIFVEC